MQCPDHTRRSLILTALATGACLATESASSEDDKPGSDERRQKGDLLVVSEGEHVGEVIEPDDLKLGSRQCTLGRRIPKCHLSDRGKAHPDHWNLCRKSR